MEKEKRKKILGAAALVLAAALWGASYFALGKALEEYPVFFVLAFRFLFGGALLLAVFHEKAFELKRRHVLWAALLALTLAAGYVLQAYGVKISSSASKAAVLSVGQCVLVPFLCFAFYKEKVSAYHVVAAIFGAAGAALMVLGGGFTLNRGDLLTVASGIFFAAQILVFKSLNDLGGAEGVLPLAFLFVGVLCGGISLGFERADYVKISFAFADLLPLLLLCVAGTAFAQALQFYGQKRAAESEASFLLSLSAVFGVIAGAALGEPLTARMLIGAGLVFVSAFICEVLPAIVKKRGEKENDQTRGML